MTEQVQGTSTSEETTTESEQAKIDAKYTDKDVDKLKGAARKEGKQTAINELLGELQVESVDDVKELVEAFRTVEEESKTEAEKLQSQLQEYQQKEAQWERERTRNAFKEQIGLSNPRLALGAALEAGIEIELDDKGNVQNLNDIRSQLKADNPREFGDGSVDGGAKGPLPGSTPQQQMGSFLGQILNR